MLVRNENSTVEWKFPCMRWFAKDDDDSQIVRDLEASVFDITSKIIYKITTITGIVIFKLSIYFIFRYFR